MQETLLSTLIASLTQIITDNNHAGVPCTRLIVRGTVLQGYYIKGNCIWEKRGSLREDRLTWILGDLVRSHDLIVELWSFATTRTGLWVLRRLQGFAEEVFTFVAYLRKHNWFRSSHWHGDVKSDAVRFLAVEQQKDTPFKLYPELYRGRQRKFTIV